jgi:hypothetical protein
MDSITYVGLDVHKSRHFRSRAVVTTGCANITPPARWAEEPGWPPTRPADGRITRDTAEFTVHPEIATAPKKMSLTALV